MRAKWTRRAKEDLLDIGRFIARDSRAAAYQFTQKLKTRATKAGRSPMASRAVPEFGRADIREIFLKTYRIIFRVGGSDIRILCVIEGHRMIPTAVDPDADE